MSRPLKHAYGIQLEDHALANAAGEDTRRLRYLWAGVLHLAMADVATGEKTTTRLRQRDDAIAWVTRPDNGRGSFEWVCDLLDIDPSATRRQILRRIVHHD